MEAYQNTGFAINIVVTALNSNSQSRILNFLTSPNVTVASAVTCSCSLPGFYASSILYAKNEIGDIVEYTPMGTKYVDGSFYSDVPINRLAELFNATTFIVS